MRSPLFDVVLSTDADADSGQFWIGVTILDRRGEHDGETIVARTDFGSLDDAIEYAKREVTDWMRRTEA